MRVSELAELAELKHGIQLRLTKPGNVSASSASVYLRSCVCRISVQRGAIAGEGGYSGLSEVPSARACDKHWHTECQCVVALCVVDSSLVFIATYFH